jgi:hypothetical protein
LRDKDGALLNGTDTYRLRVPADTPAKDFWSVIVYSMKSKGRCQSKILNTWSGHRTAQIDPEKCRKINGRKIRF